MATEMAQTQPSQTTIGSIELVETAGITYRQLDYWTRAGYLQPSLARRTGSGIHRRYPTAEIAVARTLAVVVPLRAAISDEQFHLVLARVRAGGRGVVRLSEALTIDLDRLAA